MFFGLVSGISIDFPGLFLFAPICFCESLFFDLENVIFDSLFFLGGGLGEPSMR